MKIAVQDALSFYFKSTLDFTFRTAKWVDYGDDGSQWYEINGCSLEELYRIYCRSVCEKKSAEEHLFYITEEEREDAEMFSYLIKSRGENKDGFTLIGEEDLRSFKVMVDEPSGKDRIQLQVKGNPYILQNEFKKRYYDARIFKAPGLGVLCVVDRCTEAAAQKIQSRAECMEKSEKSEIGAFYLTAEEAEEETIWRHPAETDPPLIVLEDNEETETFFSFSGGDDYNEIPF